MKTVSHLPLPRASASLIKRAALRLHKLVSGGQTGADRAALLWALTRGIPVGGWAPKNLWAEDGCVPRHLGLRETPSSSLAQRTQWNVRDSDATVLFTPLAQPHGGSRLTAQCSSRLRRPLLHLHGEESPQAVQQLTRFLLLNKPRVLNVAGDRASSAPAIADWVGAVLDLATCPRHARRTIRAIPAKRPSDAEDRLRHSAGR